MVWSRTSLRAPQHASICSTLLSACNRATVCIMLPFDALAYIICSPYDVRLWQAQGASYQEMGRLREAIECLKRALLGADANEIAIALKLARLHNDLEETADAVAYHRRVINISRVMRMSYCHQSTVSSGDADCIGKPVAEWARSAMYVARYYYVLEGGDLELSGALLEMVAGSNSEDADAAADLLKRVKAAIGREEGGVVD
jgi:anaphase-promoting complex subunit 8